MGKEPNVDVPTVVYGSSVGATLVYIIIGLLGNMAIADVSDNLLQSMISGNFGVVTEFAASLFAILIIGLGVPLFSILTRLSFTGNKLCSRFVANLGAVYFPFLVGWLLYHGAATVYLLSWGGIVSTSFVAFILPIVLSIKASKGTDNRGSLSLYFGYSVSSKAEKISLWVLLVLAIASALVAMYEGIQDDSR